MSNTAPPAMLPADGAKPTIADDAELTEANSVLIFAIEHDDGSVFEKRIPNVARPSLSYGYLRRVRQLGQVEAEAWMMWKVLGDDGLEALEEYEGMTPEVDEAIKKRIEAVTSGGAQNPKG